MFTALARVGIASVRQARETVFASDEALDLERLLAAALDPRDEAAVRALATPLLDLPLDRLQHDIHVDEAAWQGHLDRFAGYDSGDVRPMVMLTRLSQTMSAGPRRRVWMVLTGSPTCAISANCCSAPRRSAACIACCSGSAGSAAPRQRRRSAHAAGDGCGSPYAS